MNDPKYPLCIQITDGSATHTCYFHKVAGAGSQQLYHLMSRENLYLGRLHRDGDKWIFTSQTKQWEDLAAFFGAIMEEHLNANDSSNIIEIDFTVSASVPEINILNNIAVIKK